MIDPNSIQVTEHFTTPILEVMLPNFKGLNLQINSDLQDAPPVPMGKFNMFDHTGPGIDRLRRHVLELSETLSEVRPLSINRGWLNKTAPHERETPHWHRSVHIIAVYYLYVPGPNAGDLLVNDPRGANGWFRRTEGDRTGRAFIRIKPVVGKLVLMPGYLIHSVETNLESDFRVSIAINVENRDTSS